MGKVAALVEQLFTKIEDLSKNPLGDSIEEHRQIDELLCGLIEAEKEVPPVELPNRQDKWPEFVLWCSEQGVPFMERFKVKQVSPDGECGLFANDHLHQHEEILRVPRKMFLTQETAAKDPSLSSLIKDPIIEQLPNLVLSIHLLSEYLKGESSFWAPYLSTLPRSYTTVLYLSHDALVQLSGSPLLEEVVKIKRNVARQYAYLVMKLTAERKKAKKGKNKTKRHFLSPLTYELFRWAMSTVMTRQNLVPSEAGSKKDTLALVPLWDLCNHKYGSYCTDFDTSSGHLVFYSMEEYKEGEEVFNYYGSHLNRGFFLQLGFVYMEHEKDSLRIKLGFSSADSLYALKDSLAKKIKLYGASGNGNGGMHFELAHKANPFDIMKNKHLIAFVRIFLLDKKSLEEWLEKTEKEAVIDFYNDECAKFAYLNEQIDTFLKIRCTLLLRKYAQVPEGGYLNSNVEKMVACEKAILSSYL